MHTLARTTAAVLLSALVLAGCAEDADPGAGPAPLEQAGGQVDDQAGELPPAEDLAGSAACIAAVTYQGTLYVQHEAEPQQQGEPLTGAEVPPCNDTGGTDETGSPIDAYAIEGVDPRYAVMSPSPGGQFVYVADEYSPYRTGGKPLPDDVARRLGIR